MKSGVKTNGIEFYALAFGLFLGLAILKFGNPVILDGKIPPPVSISDYLNDPWPTHWANWGLLPLVLAGAVIVWSRKLRWPTTKWLWLLPLLWFGWQLLSATQTVDATLTSATLWQFFGCIACYFLGALLVGHQPASSTGFALAFDRPDGSFCLLSRACDKSAAL
jgi:hypothetical protein